MMASPSRALDPQTPTPEAHIHFRTARKRKAYRNRAGDDADDRDPSAVTAAEVTAKAVMSPPQRTVPVQDAAEVRGKGGEFVTEDAAVDAGARGKPNSSDDDEACGGPPVARLLKLRNARKSKLGGVAFCAEQSSSLGLQDGGDRALVLHKGGDAGDVEQKGKAGETGSLAVGIPKRFAPQTGVVGEVVNKHM